MKTSGISSCVWLNNYWAEVKSFVSTRGKWFLKRGYMFLDIIIGQDEAYLCLRSPEEDRHLKSREICISSDIAHRPSHGLVFLRVGSRASLWIFFSSKLFLWQFLSLSLFFLMIWEILVRYFVEWSSIRDILIFFPLGYTEFLGFRKNSIELKYTSLNIRGIC